MVALHKAGVRHGDVKADNFTLNGNDVRIIDFSVSEPNHRCPGRRRCYELLRAHRELGLASDTEPTNGMRKNGHVEMSMGKRVKII